MTSSHTPGPWKVSFESIDPDWAVVTTQHGNIIANVNSETGPDLPPCVSTKMPRDANARLIAAAPELLEALRSMMEIAGTLDEALQDGGLRETVLAEYQLAHIDAVFEMGHIALAHADSREYGTVGRDHDA